VRLPPPGEPRRNLALLGIGMGMAIAAVAIVGFKLLRTAPRAAAPIAATLVKSAVLEPSPVAPVVEPVKPEASPDEPQPPAKVATAPAKVAATAPAKVAATARAKATPTPTTTLAPEPGRRAAAKSIAEKPPAPSRRHVATRKEKKVPARRAAHARALAMREPAAKKTAASAPAESADSRPLYEHGNALLFAGDGKGAIVAYREAVRSSPSDPIGFRGLGLAYEQQGETALAIKALRRYLKLAPGAPDHDIIARRVDKLSKRAKQK
jgi:tetratricopeptide (TPR) repeat protein